MIHGVARIIQRPRLRPWVVRVEPGPAHADAGRDAAQQADRAQRLQPVGILQCSAERRGGDENPVDEHNHALAALRYLVCGLDAAFLARLRRRPGPALPPPLLVDDEHLWTRLS